MGRENRQSVYLNMDVLGRSMEALEMTLNGLRGSMISGGYATDRTITGHLAGSPVGAPAMYGYMTILGARHDELFAIS